MDYLTIINKPVITEKSMSEVGRGKFTFLVQRNASKSVVKRAIEEKFGVHVTSVSTTRIKGRTQRTGQRRVQVQLPTLKKATVTLKKGEKIDLFEIATS